MIYTKGRIAYQSSVNIENLPESVKNQVFSKISQYQEQMVTEGYNFDKKWLETQPEGYIYSGGDRGIVNPSIGIDTRMTTWSDGTRGMKDGFVDRYGSTNIKEDVATYTDTAILRPEAFAPYINPTSPKYDVRYEQKLELLYENGFITKAQAQKVLNYK